MPFTFIRELFSGHAAAAICWTLIHSLWQGLIFAIATGVVLLATKRSSPSLRYRILSGQFLFFILVVLITFVWEWTSGGTGNNIHNNATHDAVNAAAGKTAVVFYSSNNYRLLDTIAAFLSANVPVLIAGWFFIFLVKSVKIIYSLVYLQHLRNYRAHRPSADWQHKIEQLCADLQLTKTVRLLESEIIKVPAVFGHLRPVIFVPLGILSGMAPEQVEAVLVHELAHIRRSDYLFNLFQNIAGTIFFFNPALLWMSSLIREEREHCCDDIAIAQTHDKKQFIESLIRFREVYISNHSNYVTAFPGTRNSFINRITRIAMNKNKSLHPAENIFLAISLVVIGTLVMAFCRLKEPVPPAAPPLINASISPVAPPAPAATKETIAVLKNDTVPKNKNNQQRTTIQHMVDGDYSVIYSDIDKSAGRETIVFKKAGNEYKLVKLNGEIAYLMINDEKVPKDKLGEYSTLLQEINAQLERMRKEQAIRDEEQRQRNAEQEIRNKEQEQRNAEQAIRNKEQDQRNAEQVLRNEEQKRRNIQQAQLNEEQRRRDSEQLIRNKEQEQRNAEQAVRNMEQVQRNAEQEIRNKEQEVRNAEMKKLIDDLVTDNIIRDKDDLRSLTLTEDEFIVNGVKQPAEVLKKYKSKYTKLVSTHLINHRRYD